MEGILEHVGALDVKLPIKFYFFFQIFFGKNFSEYLSDCKSPLKLNGIAFYSKQLKLTANEYE